MLCGDALHQLQPESPSARSHPHLARRQAQIPVRTAALALARVLRRASVECVRLDLFVPPAAALQRALAAELAALRIRVLPALSPLVWRPSPSRGLQQQPPSRQQQLPSQMPSLPWRQRAPPRSMEANLARLYTARHAPLLVLERGSQWGDLIAMLRRERHQPTLYVAGCGAHLAFDDVTERCVRVRGRCARPERVPFGRAKGIAHAFC